MLSCRSECRRCSSRRQTSVPSATLEARDVCWSTGGSMTLIVARCGMTVAALEREGSLAGDCSVWDGKKDRRTGTFRSHPDTALDLVGNRPSCCMPAEAEVGWGPGLQGVEPRRREAEDSKGGSPSCLLTPASLPPGREVAEGEGYSAGCRENAVEKGG